MLISALTWYKIEVKDEVKQIIDALEGFLETIEEREKFNDPLFSLDTINDRQP